MPRRSSAADCDAGRRSSSSSAVTSATLRAGGDWDIAEARTGAPHLARGPAHFVAPSPFDYPERAEVLIVTNVKRGDIPQLANAYARLIGAATLNVLSHLEFLQQKGLARSSGEVGPDALWRAATPPPPRSAPASSHSPAGPGKPR